MQITLRYLPHAGQLKLHNSTAPYRTAMCGRRFGKSLAATYEIIKRVQNSNIKMCWMSPSYSSSSVGVSALQHICKDAPQFMKITGTSPKVAKFCNGVEVPFFSLDRPEFVRGRGFDFIVIDESQLIKNETFYDIISPTLAQSVNPEMLVIGTPKSKTSWFAKNFYRGMGQDKGSKYESFHFPSHSNPYLSREYLEEQRLILPINTYKREYLAEFPDEDSEIFKNLYDCINEGDPTCQHLNRSIGCDLAKMNDYCVYTCICKDCGKVVDFERFNQLDYLTVVKKLSVFQQRNTMESDKIPPTYFDGTGIGVVISDMLSEYNVKNTISYVFTNPSKEKLINDLTALIDHKKISISPTLSDLIFEMEVFTCKISSSGNFIYNAPEGSHDDCVFSLALACQGLVKENVVIPWVYDPSNLNDEISSEQNKDTLTTDEVLLQFVLGHLESDSF